MKILRELSEKELGIGEGESLGGQYELRKSARAILLNERDEMAAQYLKTYDFHKLPGGGMDAGETIEETLKREVMEEVGCDCEIVRPLGMVIEYRNKYNLLHISYGFVAKVVGEMGEVKLEEGEIEEGLTHLWIPPEEMLSRLKKDNGRTYEKYEANFNIPREIVYLEEYLKGLVLE